jgi:phosphonate transport system substrate-binding protein
VRQQIIDALITFSETEEWAESIGNQDFYGWTSLTPIGDDAFDPVRQQFEILGMTEEDVFGA